MTEEDRAEYTRTTLCCLGLGGVAFAVVAVLCFAQYLPYTRRWPQQTCTVANVTRKRAPCGHTCCIMGIGGSAGCTPCNCDWTCVTMQSLHHICVEEQVASFRAGDRLDCYVGEDGVTLDNPAALVVQGMVIAGGLGAGFVCLALCVVAARPAKMPRSYSEMEHQP